MSLSEELANLMHEGISAFASRDFLLADDFFTAIARDYPDNWTARYFHAMTLCSIGDFSEARIQLLYICNRANELSWQQVARSGMSLINNKEESFRKSLQGLLDL